MGSESRIHPLKEDFCLWNKSLSPPGANRDCSRLHFSTHSTLPPPEFSVTPELHVRTGRQSPFSHPASVRTMISGPPSSKHTPSLMNSCPMTPSAGPQLLPRSRILWLPEFCIGSYAMPTLNLSRVHDQPQMFKPRLAASLPQVLSWAAFWHLI